MRYRLLAIMYDLLLLFAILFIVTLFSNIAIGPEIIQSSRILYPTSLLLIIYLYFIWHWIHGGQTLGMKAWKLVVMTREGNNLDFWTASKRFLLALITNTCFGFGLLWAIFDPMKLTFYDRYSSTNLLTTRS